MASVLSLEAHALSVFAGSRCPSLAVVPDVEMGWLPELPPALLLVAVAAVYLCHFLRLLG